VELTFGESGGRLIVGFHAARSYWRIIDLEDCLLVPEPIIAVARTMCHLAHETGLGAYHPKTHQGFFRYLMVRQSAATGKLLVCLVTTAGSDEVIHAVARQFLARHPEAIASLYWGLTNKVADVAVPEQLLLLSGDSVVRDRIGPFELELHPFSFLQPNRLQAEPMYDELCRFVREAAPTIVWDLYCGLGVIALYVSSHARTVYGIDAEPHHVELAVRNAARNGVQNIEFHQGRVETLLRDRRFWLQEAKPDVVIVDPPRAGLHPQVVTSLLAARPKHLVYLSCNAQSLRRDLGLLTSGFPHYQLTEVSAFDMFPQTDHVETLVRLERLSGASVPA